MRKRARVLLVTPLLLLAVACDDGIVNPSHEPLFSTVESDGGHAVIELSGLMTGVHGHGRANAIHRDPITGKLVIAGASYLYGDMKAVIWEVVGGAQVSGPIMLGELPAPLSADFPYQVARDVNSAGTVVGEVLYREGNNINPNRTAGFVFDGTMKALPRFVGDTYAWFGWEVNDDGLVAGWIRYVAERDEDGAVTGIATRGALWLPPYEDEPILLGPLPGHASANARTINNDGLIAGWSWIGADSVGVYWQTDAAGSVSGPYALASGFRSTALNETGHLAGYAFGEAAHWDTQSTSLIRLGTLHRNGFSQAFGISNATAGLFRIVGWSGRTMDFETRLPTIWFVGNGSTDGPVALTLPGNYTGGYASDVDDQGRIVGVGFEKYRNQSVWRPILWLPRDSGDGDGGDDGECKPHPKHADKCR